MSNDVDRTLWVGNLSEKVTDDILYELFLQAGPLERVNIAKEKDGRQKSFAFVTFSHDVSVPYTITLMEGLSLYGRTLRLQSRPGSVHQQQQQQQQQQQSMSHGAPRNMNNPYQSNQPMRDNYGNPYSNMQSMHMNPYMQNQPVRSPHSSPQSQPPHFQRSNTWHGSDLANQQERDRDHRDSQRNRDQTRYTDRDRDRDRSTNRRRDEDGEGTAGTGRREYYKNNHSNNSNKNSTSNDFDAKRQKVLHKQEEVIQRYKQGQSSRLNQGHVSSPQSWQSNPHSNRRGRY